MELNDKKFAVLVDADNISHRKIKDILDEIANYGTPTIKRIYGDFTNPKFAAWKEVLLENSITPIQQYAYTTGKNATDSALIIDAMDILHKEGVDGFCIVSSDSDYTRLASRIRESGREVLGFGEKKTPKPFIKSCDKFIYVEILGQTPPEKAAPAKKKADAKRSAGAEALWVRPPKRRGKETVAGCGARLDDHPSVRRRIPHAAGEHDRRCRRRQRLGLSGRRGQRAVEEDAGFRPPQLRLQETFAPGPGAFRAVDEDGAQRVYVRNRVG